MNKNTFKHFQKPLFTCLTAIFLFTALFVGNEVTHAGRTPETNICPYDTSALPASENPIEEITIEN